jgi:putative glutamine amidotransferase
MASDRPLIALTCDVRVESRVMHFVYAPYVQCVERAGGMAMLIPPQSPTAVPRLLEVADAFVIVGGEDIDPALYGEVPLPTHDPAPPDRIRFDFALAKALLDTDHPVLGICYGCQLLTVAGGGSLWQDLPSQVPESLRHGGGKYPDLPRHEVEVAAGTRLRAILGADRVEVNSAHHQGLRRVPSRLVASASAPDGTIEAVEQPGRRFLVGVAWHPEIMPEAAEQQRLFDHLVVAAAERLYPLPRGR